MFGKKEEQINNNSVVFGNYRIKMLRHQVEASNNFDSMIQYDIEINKEIANLERDGFEILDIKFEAQTAPRATKMMDTIHTIISYKQK